MSELIDAKVVEEKADGVYVGLGSKGKQEFKLNSSNFLNEWYS